MSLRDAIKQDVSAIFLNTEEFAETIVYYFRAGGSRCIKAIIDREPPAYYDDSGNVVLPSYTVEIRNDCVLGVKASDIDTGGDEVRLMAELGGIIPARKTVLQITRHDMGAITLAVK